MRRIHGLDLQAKISLILVGVILPTFLIVTIVENKLIQPMLVEEMRQLGVTSGKTLAAEISGQRLFWQPQRGVVIERLLREFLYSQPDVIRLDVFGKDPVTGAVSLVASSVEEEPEAVTLPRSLVSKVSSQLKTEEGEEAGTLWEIHVPIEQRTRDPKGTKRLIGSIRVVVSLKLLSHITGTYWKIKSAGAALSVVTLILVLSYLLRKTIANDRLLRRAEHQNLQLIEQLHEAERQLMNTEKLAVMGQLTASFAHEIGTPLNAIGGHLQLLREELSESPQSVGDSTGSVLATETAQERLDIINGQLGKIEQIVKSFLQSTAKPSSQSQLVDLNRLTDQTLGILGPRLEALGVSVRRHFDRRMGPVRVVPLEMEQILLNLVNNSIDSMRAKSEHRERGRSLLEISTKAHQDPNGGAWASLSVYDTGEGIPRSDLQNVVKPFFTTKRPGDGTGLGLTICQQLARKYGGKLELDSKEGGWTRVTLKIPYGAV